VPPGPHVPHPLRPYEPLIVNVALTGMIAQRSDSPHVPLTTAEIIADGVACAAAGASILHLHARDAEGGPDWRSEAYAPILEGLRDSAPEVVLCVSTSGRDVAELDRRADVLALDGQAKPDMASLTLGSLNFRTQASVNAPRTIVALAEAMAERGIRPELEIFDTGMSYLASELLHRGVLQAPLYANLLLGGPNTSPATAGDLAGLVGSLPAGTTWAVGGLGAFQLPMNAFGVFMGGHVRTGLEDNLWFDAARSAPATNVALVERAVALAGIAGRAVATPAQTRAHLGLPVHRGRCPKMSKPLLIAQG
jgi:3-keto-5-aminohexanoate cleavage enzyme